MSKFVRLTGASLPETKWFSKACNALGGQIGHIHKRCQKKWVPVFWFGNVMKLKDAKTAAICVHKRAQPGIRPAFHPFPSHIIAVLSAIMTLFMGL